jgi:hypothetical protein
MKVYISGPVTGTDDYVERFAVVEGRLREYGYEVVNPAVENGSLPEGTSWREYMGESLRLLCGCDAIFMMRNWLQSRGAKLEYTVATHVGLKIMEGADL